MDGHCRSLRDLTSMDCGRKTTRKTWKVFNISKLRYIFLWHTGVSILLFCNWMKRNKIYQSTLSLFPLPNSCNLNYSWALKFKIYCSWLHVDDYVLYVMYRWICDLQQNHYHQRQFLKWEHTTSTQLLFARADLISYNCIIIISGIFVFYC